MKSVAYTTSIKTQLGFFIITKCAVIFDSNPKYILDWKYNPAVLAKWRNTFFMPKTSILCKMQSQFFSVLFFYPV